MFLLKLLQILFFVVIGYLLYQAIRFFLTLGRRTREARRMMEEKMKRSGEGNDTRQGKDKIIELDKDQYRVD
ncbi:MAG: hypothetical protein JXA20_06190 [Spirochaetes bacterium]|nr:hypothetical protein [Spirochaetota bacterium]